jgi:ribonuclease R
MPELRTPPAPRVGVLERRGRFTVVEPFFERGRRMAVDQRRRPDAKVGELVLVRPSRNGGGRGRVEVVRALGRPHVARDVVEALLADRGYERGFTRRVESEAGDVAGGASQEGRRDLTALQTFTIDPASARDFDDAISAERDGDGVRLSVHIADVSAYVQPGTALDAEAWERGNSVYVPGTVEPMLPKALSAGACSLVPGEPRAAVTVEMRFDAAGLVSGASFYRSTIRSDARLDYEQVDRVLEGAESLPEVVAQPLALARRVAAQLRERRMSQGGLGIESSEPEFEFDSAGDVAVARDVAQTESHSLIEQLMVAANEQVALRLENGRVPTIFRVHEQPDPAAVEYLVSQLATLDVPTPPLPKDMGPHEAGRMVGAISVRLLEYLQTRGGRGRAALTSLVLRSLKQAVYSPLNIGHAGLASASYCHFTSPIRRYPDLVVHRALLSTLGREPAPPAHELGEVAVHCTATERHAMAAEREADDICLAFVLQRELAENGWDRQFEGEVIGVIGAGVFVAFRWEGAAAECEGFLPVRRLGGDWYDMNEERTMLVGRETGRRLKLGDPVDVRVSSIEAPRGRVDLEPARR